MMMEEIYNHIYFKSEKDRIKKELLEKEIKEKERIIKIKQKWDEVFTLDHKFYFNKRSWEIFRKQKQSYYTSLNGQKLMKALNGEEYINKEE
jgi:galactose-1-phosphate uridylyltransferase